MLPKYNRLKRKSAFNATYKQKKSVSDGNICLHFGKEKQDLSTPTMFGFIVAKKVHKRAVIRNRIKRLMRESIRLMLKNDAECGFNKYISVIVTGKQGAINADFNQIDMSLKTLLKTAVNKEF